MSFHPCQSCGACCAYFRVSFYWREAEEGGERMPVPMTSVEEVDPFHRCMKGTNDKHHCRCVELKGKIGENVACDIYSLRPSPCRNFEASYENGQKNVRCDDARARYGLRPLRPADFHSQVLSKNERRPKNALSCS